MKIDMLLFEEENSEDTIESKFFFWISWNYPLSKLGNLQKVATLHDACYTRPYFALLVLMKEATWD